MNEVRRTRVVAVGMMDSVHFARWLKIFAAEPLDFFIFPSTPNRSVHPMLKELLESQGPASYRTFSLGPKALLPLHIIDSVLGNAIRALLLRNLIKKNRPDFVHSLEIQHAGYITSRAFRGLAGAKPIFILTNYGSDIFWFSRFRKHKKRIVTTLMQADRYSAECERDVRLAKSLGFAGETMPVFPNAGGFSEAQLAGDLLEPSRRNLILVKGYQGWVGRALFALKALALLSPYLQNYQIHVYSCNLSTIWSASRIRRKTGLNIVTYPKGALSHNEVLDKFSQALVYLGVSLSDGISTSLIEAMALGAIPVQTSTSCCDEWFGSSGVSIQNISVEEIATGILQAIDIARTTNSAQINRETVRAKASSESIHLRAALFYRL